MNSTRGYFLGDLGLSKVLSDLSFTALDVGARGGFLPDLTPLAAHVDAIGFEPDVEECARLNSAIDTQVSPWKSIRFLPIALGNSEEARSLNLYRQRGCSSLLEANVELAEQFSRADYFLLDGVAQVQTIPLDIACERYGFDDAVFIKLDVQGAELEILRSGHKLISEGLLVVRLEVEFIQQYRHQPLFSDIDSYLRSQGFHLMQFIDLSTWRRSTKVQHPGLKIGPVPYSRGQLVHGDAIYFRDPERIDGSSEEAVQAQLKAAFLATTYEQIDHAALLFERRPVRQHLESRYGLSIRRSVDNMSRTLGRANRRKRWLDVLHEVRALAGVRI